MPIPLYGTEAEGGRIVQLDDESVMNDLAALAGTGGSAIVPFVRSTIFDGGLDGGYSKFRRNVQHVHSAGGVTVVTTPYRDQQESGNTITDTLAVGASPVVVAPISETGTNFQVKVAVSSYTAAVELGKGQQHIVPRRTKR